MDLGLGALCSTGINNWSMEEELELTVRCADARASIMDTFYMIESAVDSLEHLIAVQTVIKQHGCTESIAYLYGENNIDMSVEGLGDTIKGVLKKIYEFIIELKNKIVSFFKNLFPKKKDSVKKATEEAKKVEEEVAKEKTSRPQITINLSQLRDTYMDKINRKLSFIDIGINQSTGALRSSKVMGLNDVNWDAITVKNYIDIPSTVSSINGASAKIAELNRFMEESPLLKEKKTLEDIETLKQTVKTATSNDYGKGAWEGKESEFKDAMNDARYRLHVLKHVSKYQIQVIDDIVAIVNGILKIITSQRTEGK